MKLSFLPFAFMHLASAAIVVNQNLLEPGPKFDYNAPLAGSSKCALVNVAMDESGSMSTEQSFMIDDAIPGMVTKLKGSNFNYDHVFVCSNGFGSNVPTPSKYQHLGCTTGYANGTLADPSIVTDWVADGSWEEGYHAIVYSIANLPESIEGINLLNECSAVDKNLILVSDEDRDADFEATVQDIKDYIEDHDYILNLVIDATIDDNLDNVGFQLSNGGNKHKIFQREGTAGGYTTFQKNDNYYNFVTHDTNWAPDTSEHYIPLVIDKPGAVWNVKSLRDGVAGNAALRASFTNAFVETKVEEISCPGGTINADGQCTCPGGTFNAEGQCTCPTGTVNVGGQCVSRTESTGIGGDPHITTWKNEHYEYHGQCDLVLVSDPNFAGGKGLDIHIRTKIVRFWSYIKTVAIRIGDDILEIEGSADANDAEPHYWVNFEYQGKLDTFAGYAVTQKLPSVYKRSYEIDLGSGEHIVVQICKEFVRVKFFGGEGTFGNTVGLMGDYKSGKTFARDGSTVINDFTELGNEWQVLPVDEMLFHDVAKPQFPEKCLIPEDPRGARRRRMGESSITIEEAERACSTLSDSLSRKDCVYDILATQDLDMVGAF